jgi:cysteine synthase A
LFLGASSATVLYAAKQYISNLNNKNLTLVAISPDFGEKYIDTVYNPAWVEEKFGVEIKKRAFL